MMRLHGEYVQAHSLAGGAGWRDGPDFRPHRDGRRQAPALKGPVLQTGAEWPKTGLNAPIHAALLAPFPALCRAGTGSIEKASQPRMSEMRHCTLNYIALHKSDMIMMLYGSARKGPLRVPDCSPTASIHLPRPQQVTAFTIKDPCYGSFRSVLSLRYPV
jgi:hypothetical protein